MIKKVGRQSLMLFLLGTRWSFGDFSNSRTDRKSLLSCCYVACTFGGHSNEWCKNIPSGTLNTSMSNRRGMLPQN